ncbi:ChbG/HpnK family deacetylase [Paenibacillus sp. YIM B09110]|uniref:ChbG/HpnK family deacetylase n=1 Tax=Paenibacillus sp. YIM B09110 TaxID=3126102 RepID=UPI00301C76CA
MATNDDGVRLLLRGDDFGGSMAANEAIREACDFGLLQNVSVMAAGPHVEEAAKLLAHRDDICFGMHITMNAEWDLVKWKPVLVAGQVPTLVDASGYFWSHPSLMEENGVLLEQVKAETIAQYDRLRQLGFRIAYVDEHMFFGYWVEGFHEWLAEWCDAQGLVNFHSCFQPLPEGEPDNQGVESSGGMNGELLRAHIAAVKSAPAGLYTVILHPATDGEELRSFGNEQYSGERIASERDAERKLLTDLRLRHSYNKLGVQLIRYDQVHG